jgi:hypothetical protein
MLEGLDHHFRLVVADAAGRDLEAVADEVVLVGLDVDQRILGSPALPVRPAAWRRGCARNRPSCSPRPIRRTGSRRSSEFEAVFIDQIEFLADLRARIAGKGGEFFGSPARRSRHRPASGQAAADRLGALLADVLGNRAGALDHAVLPRARRCSRGQAGPRPAPRSSCGRRTRGCRRSWPGWPTQRRGSSSSMRAKTLKPEPRKCSDTSCISIGLRRSGLSVPYFGSPRHRECAGILRHRLAVGEFLEHPRRTGSIASQTSSWVTKLISRSSW